MKLVVSNTTFMHGQPMHVSRRRVFRNRIAAMRQAEKWARKSLRRFARQSQRVTVENWGFTAGAFPFSYARPIVQMLA